MQNLRHEDKQIYLLFEHIPRKILSFEADQSITWNLLFSGFLPKQVRALPAIIVISGCIIWESTFRFTVHDVYQNSSKDGDRS